MSSMLKKTKPATGTEKLLLGKRDKDWDKHVDNVHQKKMTEMKPVVDTNMPSTVLTGALRTKKIEETKKMRQSEIDRENVVLYKHLAEIGKSSTVVANNSGRSLNRGARKKEIDRINAENQKIVRSLAQVKPVYDHNKWDKEGKQQDKLLNLVSEYPPPKPSPARSRKESSESSKEVAKNSEKKSPKQENGLASAESASPKGKKSPTASPKASKQSPKSATPKSDSVKPAKEDTKVNPADGVSAKDGEKTPISAAVKDPLTEDDFLDDSDFDEPAVEGEKHPSEGNTEVHKNSPKAGDTPPQAPVPASEPLKSGESKQTSPNEPPPVAEAKKEPTTAEDDFFDDSDFDDVLNTTADNNTADKGQEKVVPPQAPTQQQVPESSAAPKQTAPQPQATETSTAPAPASTDDSDFDDYDFDDLDAS